MKPQRRQYSFDLKHYYRLPATQVSLTIVMSLIIVAVFAVFALRPTLITIVTLRKTILESRKTLEQLQNKTTNVQRAAELLETIKPSLARIDLGITKEGADYRSITTQIEMITKQTGVQLQSESLGATLLYSRVISPYNLNKNQIVLALPVTLRVSGSYTNIVNFLRALTNTDRSIGIDSIVVTKEAGGKEGGVTVSLNVSGSVYYLADEGLITPILKEKRGNKL